MRNPSRKTLSSYTFSLSSCRLDVVRCAGTCLRMRSLRQMHFIFPPAEPMVSARLHFSAVQKYFLQRLFSCPWVQLGRCTSPMHMHSHRHAGHLYKCKLMDHFSSSILEEVLIMYVDSSRFYSLLSWLASPQMCAYVLFGKRSTSNSKRGGGRVFSSL